MPDDLPVYKHRLSESAFLANADPDGAPLSVEKALRSIGGRLRVWREVVQLRQADAAQILGIPGSTYQNYERDVRAPNTEGWVAFVRGGINANWLLTGEGPMLLADLKPPPMKINEGALAALLRGAIALIDQGMSIEKAAELAAEMYVRALESGEITPDGVGGGMLTKSA